MSDVHTPVAGKADAIDGAAVRAQFRRRKPEPLVVDPIIREIESRLLERLDLIKIQPEAIADLGCASGKSLLALHQRFPQARLIGVDSNAALRQRLLGLKQPSTGLWSSLRPKPLLTDVRIADLAETGLADSSLALLWSNLALHWHPNPFAVFQEWHRVLRVDGVVLFSCFGPYTLKELREALESEGECSSILRFEDMHDLGDMMTQARFSLPVMDMELLTLTYRTAESALGDIRGFGGNPLKTRFQGLRGRQWRTRLLGMIEALRRSDGLIHLTFEIAYGHAWKGRPKAKAQPGDPLALGSPDDLRQTIKGRRAP